MEVNTMEQVKLILGDWSNDGHGMTDVTNILVNCSGDTLEEAYEIGVQIVGFDIKDTCHKYEDSSINAHELTLLDIHGFDLNNIEGCYKDEDDEEYDEDSRLEDVYLYKDEFVAIWLFIAGLGFKALTGEELIVNKTVDQVVSIKIGGYGLFQN